MIDVLRIAYTPSINFPELFRTYKTPEAILDVLLREGKNVPPPDAMEKILRIYTAKGVHIVPFTKFPESLLSIPSVPAVIYGKGNIELLYDDRIIAVVGARSASSNMLHFIYKLVQDLDTAGVTIISGLALGVDTAAHKGSKRTIAVMASGLDVVYPAQNQSLFEHICGEGLVISEMPLGTKPMGRLFPRRNRLIAAIAQGIVVAEAAFQSGSLITAHYGLDFNKDIFVVPGSPMDPRNRGGNKLIKDGAALIENAADILGYYGQFTKKDAFEFKKKVKLNFEKQKIMDILSYEYISMEQICLDMEISGEELQPLLIELEIDGLIQRDLQGRVSLTVS